MRDARTSGRRHRVPGRVVAGSGKLLHRRRGRVASALLLPSAFPGRLRDPHAHAASTHSWRGNTSRLRSLNAKFSQLPRHAPCASECWNVSIGLAAADLRQDRGTQITQHRGIAAVGLPRSPISGGQVYTPRRARNRPISATRAIKCVKRERGGAIEFTPPGERNRAARTAAGQVRLATADPFARR